MKKVLLLIFAIVIALVALLAFNREKIVKQFFLSSDISGEKGLSLDELSLADDFLTDNEEVLPVKKQENDKIEEAEVKDVEIVASDLQIPWDLVFLPGGDILVTERPGNLVRLSDGLKIPISGVRHQGEGGLLGIALHPDFSQNNFLYIYLTTLVNGNLQNRVERYAWSDGKITFDKEVLSGIPGASFHDGGKIAFGPDGLLYVSTGDAGDSSYAQDRNIVAGNILRLTDEGEIPVNNPFNDLTYSYGHRNVQGLTWDDKGNLWATEHGRSGVRSGFDELNLIEPGKNYGWPIIQGDETNSTMVSPVIHSGSSITWAPGGIAYLNGSLFFSGLRGNALYQYEIDNKKITSHFFQEFGRLRGVVLGPDGFLYITTSNRDGRGDVNQGDDKIIKINPEIF